MSARGYIGYIDERDNLRLVYNHFDSYPDSLLIEAENFINENGIEKFIEIIEKAKCYGFRSFPEIFDDEMNALITTKEEIGFPWSYIFNTQGNLHSVYKYGKQITFDELEDFLDQERIERYTSNAS